MPWEALSLAGLALALLLLAYREIVLRERLVTKELHLRDAEEEAARRKTLWQEAEKDVVRLESQLEDVQRRCREDMKEIYLLTGDAQGPRVNKIRSLSVSHLRESDT